jgi:hypothetical protein
MITIKDKEVCFITTQQFRKENPTFPYDVAKTKLHFSDYQCQFITFIHHDEVKYKFILNSGRNIDKLVNAIKETA